jgi:hypothetical protein
MTVAMLTYATTEELLEAVISLWFMLMFCNEEQLPFRVSPRKEVLNPGLETMGRAVQS